MREWKLPLFRFQWEPWRDSFGLQPRPDFAKRTISITNSKGKTVVCRKCKQPKHRVMWTYHYEDVWGCECPGTVKALGKHPRGWVFID